MATVTMVLRQLRWLHTCTYALANLMNVYQYSLPTHKDLHTLSHSCFSLNLLGLLRQSAEATCSLKFLIQKDQRRGDLCHASKYSLFATCTV